MKNMYYLVNRMKLFHSIAQQPNRNTAVEKSGTISREEWEGICFLQMIYMPVFHPIFSDTR